MVPAYFGVIDLLSIFLPMNSGETGDSSDESNGITAGVRISQYIYDLINLFSMFLCV